MLKYNKHKEIGEVYMDIRGNYTQLTERNSIEEKLNKSEAKYRKLFDGSNDGFWWIDKYGHLVEVNEESTEILGYSKKELIGKHWTEFGDGKWLEIGKKKWEERKSKDLLKVKLKMKKKDGDTIWIRVRGLSLLDDKNSHAATLLEFKDISEEIAVKRELKKCQEKVLGLVSEIEKADKSKNLHIRILSHEIKNPLATITSGMELLELTNNDEKVFPMIKTLRRQTYHLSKIIGDLLDITSITYKNI